LVLFLILIEVSPHRPSPHRPIFCWCRYQRVTATGVAALQSSTEDNWQIELPSPAIGDARWRQVTGVAKTEAEKLTKAVLFPHKVCKAPFCFHAALCNAPNLVIQSTFMS